MKKIIMMMVAVSFFASTAFAGKTTYIATNHRFNYVKLKEIKGKELEERQITQPATLDEQGLRAALASIKLSRSFLIKKEVDDQQVFDENALNFLAPNLVKAFAEASSNEEVVFSYLSKNPIFILRNDRLNIAKAWIHDKELHVKFEKLYAKITEDVDKRGNEARAISRAQGFKVHLELGEGQKLGISDPEEIVLDINYNYVKIPEPVKEPEQVTMAGEKIKASKKVAKEAAQAAPPAPTAESRLEELKGLHEKGLIDKKEYETKRKEILNSL